MKTASDQKNYSIIEEHINRFFLCSTYFISKTAAVIIFLVIFQ